MYVQPSLDEMKPMMWSMVVAWMESEIRWQR